MVFKQQQILTYLSTTFVCRPLSDLRTSNHKGIRVCRNSCLYDFIGNNFLLIKSYVLLLIYNGCLFCKRWKMLARTYCTALLEFKWKLGKCYPSIQFLRRVYGIVCYILFLSGLALSNRTVLFNFKS